LRAAQQKKLIIAKGGHLMIRSRSELQVGSTRCRANEWEAAAPSAVHDRVCTLHKVCDSTTQWEAKAAGASSDRECKAHTTCSSTQWESKVKGTHHDRGCIECAACPAGLVRQSCGGTFPGWCLLSECLHASVNCWVGPSGDRWLQNQNSWNKAAFPSKEYSVILGADSRLVGKHANAQRVRVMGADVKLTISGGKLRISKP
jgi:hypothetical protein